MTIEEMEKRDIESVYVPAGPWDRIRCWKSKPTWYNEQIDEWWDGAGWYYYLANYQDMEGPFPTYEICQEKDLQYVEEYNKTMFPFSLKSRNRNGLKLLKQIIEKALETENIFLYESLEKIQNNLFDMYLYMDKLETLLEKDQRIEKKQQKNKIEEISLCCGHVVLKKDFQNAGNNCPTCEMDKDFCEMCGIKE